MIRTVLGDIDSSELGVTHCHEHLLMTGGWPVMNEPDFRLDSVSAAEAELAEAGAAGLAAVIEMTPPGFGRSPDGLKEISRTTGTHVIATTGLHKSSYYADTHWLHTYPTDRITQLLVDEIELGMDVNGLEGPVIDRSTARAGIVKVATLYHRFGKDVERFTDAVAAAHGATGVPVSTHNEKGTFGHELLDRLEAAGAPPTAVMLGHIDHNPDPGYLAELASRGAYLIFDRPGRIKYAPDSDSIELLTALIAAGHTDRLLLGCDLARASYWKSRGGGPGLSYLLTRFIPRMRAAGLESEVTRILVDNPARALTFRTPV